ncbi:hypothetical protein GEMRC1_011129 [Eukaryota sp. GEM-RC1]
MPNSIGNAHYGKHVVIGSEWMFFIITLCLVITPSIISLILDTPYVLEVSPIFTVLVAVFLAISLSCLLLTAFSDPGFIPPPETSTFEAANSMNRAYGYQHKPSITRAYFPDKKDDVFVSRLCPKCSMYRPPGAHHCSTCNCCVRHFDHHCLWIGTCIGERNYSYFLWFILSLSFSFASVAVSGFLTTFYVSRSIADTPISFVNAVFASVAFTFPFLLFFFHLHLLSRGLSTYDHIKAVPDQSPRSIKSCCFNFKSRFCVTARSFPSYIFDPSSRRYVVTIDDDYEESNLVVVETHETAVESEDEDVNVNVISTTHI